MPASATRSPARHRRPEPAHHRGLGDRRPRRPEDDGRRLVWCPCWTRSDPADNHYAHPIAGSTRSSISTMEVVRIEDHGVTPLPPSPATTRRRPSAVRNDLRPLEIVQPEGPSFEVDGWQRALAEVALRIGFTPARGPRPARGRLRGRRTRARPVLPPRLVLASSSSPTATPGPGGYRRTRSTSASTGSARSPTRSSSAATASARSATSTSTSPTPPARPYDDRERDLPARGGRRAALEAHRLATGHDRGPPLAPPRRLLDRDRRQLRVRASTGTCTRTARSSRGQAHRDRPDRRLPTGEEPRHGTPARARSSPRPTTSTSSAPGSTSTSTARRTRSSRSTPSRARRAGEPSRQRVRQARETPLATEPTRASSWSTRSAPASGRS